MRFLRQAAHQECKDVLRQLGLQLSRSATRAQIPWAMCHCKWSLCQPLSLHYITPARMLAITLSACHLNDLQITGSPHNKLQSVSRPTHRVYCLISFKQNHKSGRTPASPRCMNYCTSRPKSPRIASRLSHAGRNENHVAYFLCGHPSGALKRLYLPLLATRPHIIVGKNGCLCAIMNAISRIRSENSAFCRVSVSKCVCLLHACKNVKGRIGWRVRLACA